MTLPLFSHRQAVLLAKFEEACSALTALELERLRAMLEHGLTPDAAWGLMLSGCHEEATAGTESLNDWAVSFTPSAKADLDSFRVGWPARRRLEELLGGLSFAATHDRGRCQHLEAQCFWLLRDDVLRIVFKWEPDAPRGVIYAITCAGVNPLAKVWRYFDQSKALNLLQTGELYFRRADLLPGDPLEVRLTAPAMRMQEQAFRPIFGADAERFASQLDDHTSGTTYICCWTRREHESHMAWSHYCSKAEGRPGGGFAIQTRWRRLIHLHSILRAQNVGIYCKSVGYLHPEDPLPSSDLGEAAFWKRICFSDESEIRLATLRQGTDHGQGASEAERIPFDLEALAETIVWNPFASGDQRTELMTCFRKCRPELLERLQDSMIPRRLS